MFAIEICLRIQSALIAAICAVIDIPVRYHLVEITSGIVQNVLAQDLKNDTVTLQHCFRLSDKVFYQLMDIFISLHLRLDIVGIRRLRVHLFMPKESFMLVSKLGGGKETRCKDLV